ncbi:response regulator transcription factor [Leucobacter aridicollis]|uniref:response regulator transcription factor n=1 Tax=Leucobacter aridicollis TaxID=283878 RepID=UPI002169119B|nr:response regulator [Leucobacter aridicollis]MCS3427055.1 two-component system CitB family response regulator [Leucobacter aridicollis]
MTDSRTRQATRVLIVDDDAGARQLHSRFVANAAGFAVVAAVGTGLAAVERIVRGEVDLVLLDMRLPDISGVEVLNRVRTLGPASPDVLVISASQDRVTVRQALAGQVVGYLVKPFTEAALLGRLQAYRSDLARGEARPEDARELPLAQGEIDRLLSTGSVQALREPSGAHRSPIAQGDAGQAGRAGRAVARQVGPAGRTGQAAQATAARLPKGISQITLTEIVAALDPVIPLTSAALAEACSVSSATARRYLDYLVEIGSIDLSHRYGKRGRPEVLYRLVPPPTG